MTVAYEKKSETIALITLDRPESLNAFNKELRKDLTDTLKRVNADPSIRVIVLTGRGRGFSAGADVVEGFNGVTVEDMLNAEYGAFLSIIMGCERPVIAAINGPAAGIGMTLALACDLRVMAENAYMMSAFSNIGLVPDGGLSWLLTQEVGYARAYEMAIEAQKIPAERCRNLGLVNRVVADDEVLSNACDWAASIAERAPLAMSMTKRSFRAAAQAGMRNAMAYEAMLQNIVIGSEDFREGVSALLEKRKPVFKGR